jgi:L,D-peptidoglycan transpeptidase YkuD (ErfK/YbiS/YcfS/YnhG family)
MPVWSWAWPALQTVSWTAGCIALRNQSMDEVWAAVDAGTPIEIRP